MDSANGGGWHLEHASGGDGKGRQKGRCKYCSTGLCCLLFSGYPVDFRNLERCHGVSHCPHCKDKHGRRERPKQPKFVDILKPAGEIWQKFDGSRVNGCKSISRHRDGFHDVLEADVMRAVRICREHGLNVGLAKCRQSKKKVAVIRKG